MHKDTLNRDKKERICMKFGFMKSKKIILVSILTIEGIVFTLECMLLSLGISILQSSAGNFLGVSLTVLSIFTLLLQIFHTLYIFHGHRFVSRIQSRIIASGLIILSYTTLFAVHIYISISAQERLNDMLLDLSEFSSCSESAVFARYSKAYLISHTITQIPSHVYYCNKTVILDCPCYQNGKCLADYHDEVDLLSYIEQEYECGGMCQEMPQYFSSGNKKRNSCAKAVGERFEKSGRFISSVMGIISSLLVIVSAFYGWREVVINREEMSAELHLKNDSKPVMFNMDEMMQESTSRENRNECILPFDIINRLGQETPQPELPSLISRKCSSNFISQIPNLILSPSHLSLSPAPSSSQEISRNLHKSSEKRPYYYKLHPSSYNSSKNMNSVAEIFEILPQDLNNEESLKILTSQSSIKSSY